MLYRKFEFYYKIIKLRMQKTKDESTASQNEDCILLLEPGENNLFIFASSTMPNFKTAKNFFWH